MIQQDQFHQAIPSRAALLKRAQSWASVLLDGPVSYFPVRHHSPACAKHLALWIDRFQPKSIIVEAPCSLNQWLPALASEDCIGPVAMLTTYRESDESTRSDILLFIHCATTRPSGRPFEKEVKLGLRSSLPTWNFQTK